MGKKITYIFGYGRMPKILSNEIYAQEFFYSYSIFNNENYDLDVIEMGHLEDIKSLSFRFLLLIDRVLVKISRLPFYTRHISSFNNIKRLVETDVLISTNHRMGLSIFPIYLLSSIYKKTNFIVISMGLIAEMKLGRFVTFFRKVFLKVFLSFVDKIVFLGDGEYQLAKKQYPKFSHKFIFLPFCVDYDFWSEDDNSLAIKKEGILFVGNDGKRDYLKLIAIAKVLQDFSFTFVTDNELILKSNEIPNNVKIINGSWHDELLTDQELRRIYTEAKITILPLKESFQPSGQSVTLQSICAGTPVLISDTKGFWDKAKFVNNKNIIYVNDNSVSGWVDEITKIYNNEELLKNISYKGSKLIKEHFKLEIFDKNLLDLVNKK